MSNKVNLPNGALWNNDLDYASQDLGAKDWFDDAWMTGSKNRYELAVSPPAIREKIKDGFLLISCPISNCKSIEKLVD